MNKAASKKLVKDPQVFEVFGLKDAHDMDNTSLKSRHVR